MAEAEAQAEAEAEAQAAAEAAAKAIAEAEAKAEAEAVAIAEAAAAEAHAIAEAAAEAEAAAVAVAEAEAAAAEKAVADAELAAQAKQVDERTTLLVEMGFTEAQAAAALDATQGSLERAAEWLFVEAMEDEFPAAPAEATEATFPAEWAGLLRDLLEMGFEEESSKEVLVQGNGDLKAAVKALVDMERRC